MDIAYLVAAARGRASPPPRPRTVDAIYSVAHWLLARERPADAAKVFRVLLRVAPRDERGWLGLGECHERVDQLLVATELYGAGSVLAGVEDSASVRCLLARARAMAKLGRDEDVAAMVEAAERAAAEQEDPSLAALVQAERGRLP